MVGNYIMQSVGLRQQSGLVREVWHLRSNLCQSVPFWGVCWRLLDRRQVWGTVRPVLWGCAAREGGTPRCAVSGEGTALRAASPFHLANRLYLLSLANSSMRFFIRMRRRSWASMSFGV